MAKYFLLCMYVYLCMYICRCGFFVVVGSSCVCVCVCVCYFECFSGGFLCMLVVII